MSTLQGKRIIVSGGGGVQGGFAASLFAGQGARVIVADFSREAAEAAAEVAREAGAAAGGSAVAITSDIASPESWREVVGLAETEFGGLDGLANYAAILSRGGVEDTDDDIWDRTLKVNATGAWYGMRAAIPLMRASGGGSIVNVGSVDGLVGRGGNTAYQASKGALRLLSLSAATQYASEGIRVNCVHPGPMKVRMAQVVGKQADAAQIAGLEARLTAQVPLGRLGQAEDIGWAVRYLLSDESSFVTGVDLPVDGGLTAQ